MARRDAASAERVGDEEAELAATQIQAVQRGRAARHELADKQAAAAKLQAVHRGNAGRQELASKQLASHFASGKNDEALEAFAALEEVRGQHTSNKFNAALLVVW